MTARGIIGLKIDIDTYEGMRRGVPNLLDDLSRLGIRASFFLSMGPDASGLALLQLLRNPLFLKKMIRSRAPALYGWKTALYGVLLPSPLIGLSFPALIRRMLSEGHEVQFHAWDHRRWQDGVLQKPEEWIVRWFEKGLSACEETTGLTPPAFGAPAWLIDDRGLAVVKDLGFSYLSCTRAQQPFVHQGIGLIDIPSDLPCFEETGIGQGQVSIVARIQDGGYHVLPVHAEVEGGLYRKPFLDLIHYMINNGYLFETLNEIWMKTEKENLQVRRARRILLPGRSAPCCV
jgi:peptidoglycan/xylan/chitin deacetylase (PgdA/CDA1 family)